ncbi:Spatacsin [Microtus ochrogaster]|uniref:Spatacsin n=1 Tax=Microtus ochrogaster TaxID=79684 RepID=A0A8J6G7V1_MICOH|nr:Spatacsin [Microtus ochrogaster]
MEDLHSDIRALLPSAALSEDHTQGIESTLWLELVVEKVTGELLSPSEGTGEEQPLNPTEKNQTLLQLTAVRRQDLTLEYRLVVCLLTSIGRSSEMTYMVDLLHQKHYFEVLMRKKLDPSGTLKTALLDYIKRCCPGDSEKHDMIALCFSMCREIGENQS